MLVNFLIRRVIISFTYIHELEKILTKLGEEDYVARKDAIRDNFIRAHNYIMLDDYIYFHFLRKLETGAFLV